MKLTALFNKGAHRRPGGHADLVLVDLGRPTLMPVHTEPMRNLAPNLVYAARGDEVDTVVIDGQVVVEHGRALTLDEAAVLADAGRLAGPIGALAGPRLLAHRWLERAHDARRPALTIARRPGATRPASAAWPTPSRP